MPPNGLPPAKPLRMELSNVVQRALAVYGGTQQSIAVATGTKQYVVSRWGNPHSDYVPNLIRVASAPRPFATPLLDWAEAKQRRLALDRVDVATADPEEVLTEARRSCLDVQRALEDDDVERRLNNTKAAARRSAAAMLALHALAELELERRRGGVR